MSENITKIPTASKQVGEILEAVNGIFLAFVDAIGKPIANLIVKI